MQEVWSDSHADRLVAQAIEALFTTPGDPRLVRLIHRLIPDLGPGAIRKALARRPSTVRVPTIASTRGAPTRSRRSRRNKSLDDEGWRSVTLADVAAAGLLRLPAELETTYKGRRLIARIDKERQVEFDGTGCASVSMAAAMARASVIGPRPDGRYPQTNGWTFWRVRDSAGALRSLDDLRRRALT